jgi:UDP-N-acetylglucosamine 2-epimerase
MSSGKSLGMLTSRLFYDIDKILEVELPDWLIVQGDTTSAMVGAMCAFYRKIKVAHVEAGLRTFDKWSPFPEEINRTIIGKLAEFHFAPTKKSADNLLHAGVPPEAVFITGNTVVDALLWISRSISIKAPTEFDSEVTSLIEGKRLVLVTSHRRESFGEGLANICRAIRAIVEQYGDVVVVYPVHLNPRVQEPVHRLLGDHPRIKLLPPIGYVPLIWLMKNSYIILTDSGGLQEEAPAFGKPVLILRDTTERTEALEAGCARLVGTKKDDILAAAGELFDNSEAHRVMASVKNPFGDGLAAERITETLILRDCTA